MTIFEVMEKFFPAVSYSVYESHEMNYAFTMKVLYADPNLVSKKLEEHIPLGFKVNVKLVECIL